MSTPEPGYYNYIITNVEQQTLVTLDNANDETPLRARTDHNAPNEQWIVEHLSSGKYLIRNAKYNDRFANVEHNVGRKDVVGGRDDEQHWAITETGTGGEYSIWINTVDGDLYWVLEDGQPGTPIALRHHRADPNFQSICRWTFKMAICDAVAKPDKNQAKKRPKFIRVFLPKLKPVATNQRRMITGILPSSQPEPEVARQDHIITGAPSGSQPTRGLQYADVQPSEQPTPSVPIAVVDMTLFISEVTDLRGPLNAMSKALEEVLETAESMDDPNEVWKWPTKRFRFHLDTIKSQSVHLEEDFRIAQTILSAERTVIKPLEMYARDLSGIYRLMRNSESHGAHNKETVHPMIRDMDVAFQEYTTALHDLAAQVFTRMNQKLVEIGQVVLDDVPTINDGKAQMSTGFSTLCLQGTRERTHEAIRKWADEESSENPVFLLLDVAGSGKSTVAKHMAEEWKRNKRLVARFFFSRDTETTMRTDTFCSIVADAFLVLDSKFGDPIKKFKGRPDFERLSFEEMFNGLVIEPLENLDQNAILIVDALDECDNQDGSRDELLRTIHNPRFTNSRLRILATGRPERDIKEWAKDSGVEYFNFIGLEGSDKDVEFYIKDRLKHRVYIQEKLYPVIKHADGLFICARIACDLILKTADIGALLEELKSQVSLDYLYKAALDQSIPKDESSRQAFILVLQMILASREPLSIAQLELLSPKRGIVDQIVTCIGALLLYKDREDPIRLLHATFREFLTSRSKSGNYFIQVENGHHVLASGCLDFIRGRLGQDDATLLQLDRVSQRTYVYSSESWVYHFTASHGKLALNKLILDFANRGLQDWAYFADKWYYLETISCLNDVLRLSHQNMASSTHVLNLNAENILSLLKLRKL